VTGRYALVVDDASHLGALLDGDEKAFAELVRRHHASMVRVARGYVGSQSSAEDVAQDTWVAVIQGADRFEGRSSFATWLFRILVNRARTAGARESRTAPIDIADSGPSVDASRFDEGGMWAEPPVPFTDVIDGQLEDAETVAVIRLAIVDLPEPHQAVVTLRDVEGLSTMEVAEVLGMTEGNARVVLHRARARIRAAVEAATRGAG
jgi:RNA polymerase sigma-70 factor, ECF subfamily